jgi:hypothetical protein
MAIDTFGDYLDFHSHLHALVAHGLFARSGVFPSPPAAAFSGCVRAPQPEKTRI